MAPTYIPESSRLPSDHDTNAAIPANWACYRFFWAGYVETPYYYNNTLGLCTTLDLSNESTTIPEDVINRCQTRPYGQEILLYLVYNSEEKREEPSFRCMEIDHVSRRAHTVVNGVLEGEGNEDQYNEYVMYTHNSHLKWSDGGHCAAVTLMAQIQSEHCFMPGRAVMMLDRESSKTVMDLLGMKAPDGSRHPFCVNTVKDVLERWAWVGLRTTPEHNFWNLRSPDNLTLSQTVLFHFAAWVIFLRTPYNILRRLEKLCEVRDFAFAAEWTFFIQGMRASWSDLNIVHALILSATTALLNLTGMPGVGGNTTGELQIQQNSNQPSQYEGTLTTTNAPETNSLPAIARTAAIISLFLSLCGILSGLILLTIHTGRSDVGVHTSRPYLLHRYLTFMSILLSLPITFLVWSVVSFGISLISWLLIDGVVSTNLVCLIVGSISLSSIMVLEVYFWNIWSEHALERRMNRAAQ